MVCRVYCFYYHFANVNSTLWWPSPKILIYYLSITDSFSLNMYFADVDNLNENNI